MKKAYLHILLFSILFVFNFRANAQNICMVTADFQTSENYMVIWEEFADVSNIDSIFIYRKKGIETVFTKIGAVDVTLTSPTYFVDNNAHTMDTTKYAISYLYISGGESARSPWHQAVVMDYNDSAGLGELTWTKYRKEDQINEDYIFSYECRMDESGLGNYETMSIMMNYQVNWTDQAFALHPNARYEVLVTLPTCNVVTKANINTSRSNIKNQQSNASIIAEEEAAGIAKINGVKYTLAPNPVVNELTVTTEELINGKVWISNVNGENLVENTLNGNSISFDTSLFASGIYFISIESNGVVTSKKFIKK